MGTTGMSCKRRQPTSTNPPKSLQSRGSDTEPKPPPLEAIRDNWLLAVQEENAQAAGWCARLCEGFRGAEAFAACDGLEAFLHVAMGQSMKDDGAQKGGLMVALAQALMTDMPSFKVAIFETLAAAARWPSLRGQVAGSGVLGVVTATLLAPRHPPPIKGLMAKLVGLCSTDAPEPALLGDPRRVEEFAKMRGQLLSSGTPKALVALLGSDGACVAAAGTLALLAGPDGQSDETTRKALVEAGMVEALMAQMPGWVKPSGSADVEVDGRDDASMPGDANLPQTKPKTVDGDQSASEDDEDIALPAVLTALTAVARCEGSGAAELWEPLCKAENLHLLRDLLKDDAPVAVSKQAIEQVLTCLSTLGRPAPGPAAVPAIDDSLAADLRRLLVLGSEAVGVYLKALLSNRKYAAQLGDLRPLRQSLRVTKLHSEVVTALESIQACDQCGKTSEIAVLSCGGCKKAVYCSRECQKAAWKSHKTSCAGASKR
eukprot:TRINITY_DN24568_c0_g1_i1.p1 TRINITY_DN24568_c0_g1~~TRINITY_DN24568_c0_g1_i1.p1  ORF type:complete len:530 (-),score=96.21 TRINITY_DN24568_c0_g1_i1:458-1918(-)